jgi:hypothetical protein
LFAKVVKNYGTRNKNHAKTAETCKNGRKKKKNIIFFTKIFDIYKNCCNFAQNFSETPIKKLNV